MENSGDLLEWLGPDISFSVFMRLDDPSDLVHASSVSRSWRHFVIANGFCKNLCIRMFPEVSCFTCVIEESKMLERMEAFVESSNMLEAIGVGSSNSIEWEILERDHRAYTYLARCLLSPMTKKQCALESISASSTDNYPEESIENTLEPSDRVERRPSYWSYWSSQGESDPNVPETLTYRLSSKFVIVDEINIQPFQAYFQYYYPIYAAKAVRFRMGHSKLPLDTRSNIMDQFVAGQKSADDNYIWTYVSPVFEMVQKNCLQTFKLPRPIICVGGILQIELLGRVQRQEMDSLYYICVCHVQVMGRSLSPAFSIDFPEIHGECILKYCPGADVNTTPSSESEDEANGPSGWRAFADRIRQISAGRRWNRAFLNTLLRSTIVHEDNE